MITKFIVGLIIFAGIVYYYNIDVRKTVDATGIPTWLEERGYTTSSSDSSTTTTATAISTQ